MVRWSSVSTTESATFHVSCTRLSDVLTCCPPGPDERENLHWSSEAGMVRAGDTSRSMQQGSHEFVVIETCI